MATIAINRYQQPIYDRTRTQRVTMKKRDLTPIIEKVKNLQQLTSKTGFQTGRSICALLADLTPDELVEVNQALSAAPNK